MQYLEFFFAKYLKFSIFKRVMTKFIRDPKVNKAFFHSFIENICFPNKKESLRFLPLYIIQLIITMLFFNRLLFIFISRFFDILLKWRVLEANIIVASFRIPCVPRKFIISMDPVRILLCSCNCSVFYVFYYFNQKTRVRTACGQWQ